MNEKYKCLSKNVLLFLISGFVPKVLSFFMVPLYTGCLTTAEYGISDLITTTVILLIPVFTLDIQDAVMRFALDKEYQKKDVFSYGLKVILCGTGIVTLGAFLLNCLHLPGLKSEYILFTVLMYFSSACSNIFSLFCKGIDQVKVLTIGSIINSGATLTANILLLVVFKWGLLGYLVANTLGAAITTVFIFVKAKLYRYISFSITPNVGKRMRNFSFPLIFSVIAWWVNSASDRYIITAIAGVAVSGVYAVAYKIPSLLTTFQNVFAQAWSISVVKEFDANDSDGFIGNMYTMINAAMVILCSLIMIVNMPFARILYAKDFFSAWQYIPPLLISVVFNAMALFIGSVFTAVKDTRTLSMSTIIGAAVNTICNFVFIYCWGAYGAALATLFGYAVTLLIRHIILRKYICIRVHWKRDILGYFILFIQMGIASFAWTSIPLQCFTLIALLVIYQKEIRSIVNKACRIGLQRVRKRR